MFWNVPSLHTHQYLQNNWATNRKCYVFMHSFLVMTWTQSKRTSLPYWAHWQHNTASPKWGSWYAHWTRLCSIQRGQSFLRCTLAILRCCTFCRARKFLRKFQSVWPCWCTSSWCGWLCRKVCFVVTIVAGQPMKLGIGQGMFVFAGMLAGELSIGFQMQCKCLGKKVADAEWFDSTFTNPQWFP